VSYFEHTKADLAKQRAAGLIEGRREVAEYFAALAEDTARKMNGETATDPDAEKEYDRQYLLEDLLSRVFEIAKNYAEDMPELFPALADNRRATPAYPLLIEEKTAAGEQENTIDLTDAIRETWALQTFDGLPRHEHEGEPDEKCRARVRPVYGDATPFVCGRYYGHEIHETDYETRTR
jgi:hypothetical protein